MRNPLAKTPFALLLTPFAIGILIQCTFSNTILGAVFIAWGVVAIVTSYLLPQGQRYSLRWMFGAGMFAVLTGCGILAASISQQEAEFTFGDEKRIYRGIVIDMPQEKPRSTAYKVSLPGWDKKIVCYVQPGSLVKELSPGDEFIFEARIEPFRNSGNPGDFDYAGYMSNQGYAGSAYIAPGNLMPTGNEVITLKTKAQRIRTRIIRFYEQLGFSRTQHTILAALTLGYQEGLPDDIKQSFRATGTAHVLSVSGLHVGIIYAVLSFMLCFIKRTSRVYWLRPGIIIILLWIYAFITGLPPSVIRAAFMLTLFCLSEIFNRNNYSLNGLYMAAFIMLLVCPLWLFDVGFQLSFVSVFAILYLHPKAVALINAGSKPKQWLWQMFSLSVVAQLATFPLCLYYFGTFPTYFFLSNMLIIPLVTFITYAAMGIVAAKLLTYLAPEWGYYLFYLPVRLMQWLVDILEWAITFFERLPYALIEDMHIPGIGLLLLIVLITSGVVSAIYKKPKALITALATALVMLGLQSYSNMAKEPDRLIVYNRRGATELRWYTGGHEYSLKYTGADTINRIYKIKDKSLLVLSTNIFYNKQTTNSFEADVVVLTKDNTFSILDLKKTISPRHIILDGSLSGAAIRRLVNESQKHNVTCHDVTQSGAFTLNF